MVPSESEDPINSSFRHVSRIDPHDSVQMCRQLSEIVANWPNLDLLETRYLYWIDYAKKISFWMGLALAGYVGVSAISYTTLGCAVMASVCLPILIGGVIYLGFQDCYRPSRKHLMNRLIGNYLDGVEEREDAVQSWNRESIRSAALGERTALEQLLQVLRENVMLRVIDFFLTKPTIIKRRQT